MQFVSEVSLTTTGACPGGTHGVTPVPLMPLSSLTTVNLWMDECVEQPVQLYLDLFNIAYLKIVGYLITVYLYFKSFQILKYK